MPHYLTHSEDETIALGRRLAAEWPTQALVLLIGDLGAGKTTLTKGIVAGLDASTRAKEIVLIAHEITEGSRRALIRGIRRHQYLTR